MTAEPDNTNPVIEPAAGTRKPYGWPALAIAILFGIFYAYDLWEAISNLIELPRFYELAGLDPAGIPWVLLFAGIALPLVVFVLAFLISRRFSLFGQALAYFVGLAVVASLSLSLVALAATG